MFNEVRTNIKSKTYKVNETHSVKIYMTYKEIDEYIKSRLTDEEAEIFKNATFVPFKIERFVDEIEIELRPTI